MTKIWAHRGASGYAPENTIEAFALAAQMGADGVELDVQLTRDGYVVVVHDERIDRVSNGSGFVKDYTLKELRAFNFNRMHPEYENVIIPTLYEVYDLLKNTTIVINVELKTGIYFYDGIEERVVELTRRMGLEERVIYSSFNHNSLRHIRFLNPTAQIGVLYSDGLWNPTSYAINLQANALHPAFYNLQYPKYMELAKEKGLKVHVWTVNNKECGKKCLDMGVDAIITNFPDLLLKITKSGEDY